VATLSVAIWLARRDSRWRRAEQADRDAAQARLIAVEPVYDPNDYPDVGYMLRVLNGSQHPVFGVKIIEFRNEDPRDLRWKVYHRYSDGFPTEARVLAAGDLFRLPAYYCR
jgi:hypothetical protein